MNIKEAIRYGIEKLNKNNIDEANLKIKMLLSYILGKTKEYFVIHGDESLSLDDELKFKEGINKLNNNIPIQYVIHKQEFMGYEFYVDENVLIPQPDTEILVEEVVKIAKEFIKKHKKGEEIKILDLCTGSGAIGISLSKILGDNAFVTVSDISEDIIDIVEINSRKNLANLGMVSSDLFDNIYGKYDIIVSNPPYIETDVIKTLSKEVQNEPIIALDGGQDGLDFYRRIVKDAKKFLNENGFLALEIGYNQRESVEKLLKENNYKSIYSQKDLGGNDRIVVANI